MEDMYSIEYTWWSVLGEVYSVASVQPLSMKYQCISIKLRAIGVAETAPKVKGVAAWS